MTKLQKQLMRCVCPRAHGPELQVLLLGTARATITVIVMTCVVYYSIKAFGCLCDILSTGLFVNRLK